MIAPSLSSPPSFGEAHANSQKWLLFSLVGSSDEEAQKSDES